MPILEALGLTKRYTAGDQVVTALEGINLRIEPGEFLAITGPSGSGKSTLLSLLAGLERPVEGEVLLEGRPLSQMSDTALAILRRKQLGFVFQTFNLIPVLSLGDNVGLPFLLDGLPRREWQPRVTAALEAVGLSHRAKHLPDRVSVGERQRAAVARALVVSPTILFADEPTGSLDSQRGDEILTLLRRAKDELGRTVVLVTHDRAAAMLADREIRLKDGRLQVDP